MSSSRKTKQELLLLRLLDETSDLLEKIIEENPEDSQIFHYEEALFLISDIADGLKMFKVLEDLVTEKGCYLVSHTPDC